jgi:Family of unknown function (DUF6510)
MNDRALDGNTAGGVLSEIFPFEMTMSRTICSTCGARGEIGALEVYMDAPGMVIRCSRCHNVQIRLVHGSGRYWLDLRGVTCLEMYEESDAATRGQ